MAARPPRGVTGFWTAGQMAPPDLDRVEFLGVCHTVARLTGGKVVGYTPASPACSFVAVSFVYPDRSRADH